MPLVLPTPDELRHLTAPQRDKARRAIWAILRETDERIVREVRNVASAEAFGEAVREQARQLERFIRRDPPWVIAERVRELMKAVA